ncbi:prospero homeobox protein 1 [Nothobranchius furzeri]|uniref:prospero homeobox protein 1 n=1 Tax=Nothobranchius furzeri TaxID=105023 RepID=UPI003904643E
MSFCSFENAGSSLLRSSQMEPNPSRKGGVVHLRRTPSDSYNRHLWDVNNGHQAKRARVENIIKGISCTDVTNKLEPSYVKDEANPDHMERGGSESLGQNQLPRKQHQHCRPRTKFGHMEGERESPNGSKEEEFPVWTATPETYPDAEFDDPCSKFESSSGRKCQGWKVRRMNYFQSKPDRIKLMADILKYELSRAVSRSVDSIFKSTPLLQTSSSDVENSETETPFRSTVCEDKFRFSCCGTAEVPDIQTEALPLVVQKPDLEQRDNFVPQPGPAAPCFPKQQTQIRGQHQSVLRREQTEQNYSADHCALRCWEDGCSEAARSKLDTQWNSVKVKSKVNSRSVRSPPTSTTQMDPMLLESLCLPQVKLEADNPDKNNPYVLNECLTTNHLKKAKLMFFYTRYPSSLVLRVCFHDVQFTRCITSQLIKWFSNFREFYYIQMEKFARNALMEGVVDVRDLTVDRESELFRALNIHYNKANSYQVPERFLEVAEITLREFYIAISLGRDYDPSWKKAIYKVICKLESDVPAEFKKHYTG